MNVVVNGRFIARRITGIERYATEILQRLPGNLRIVYPEENNQRWSIGGPGHFWEQAILPMQIAQGDILWSPANTGPISVTNQALALHDTSPLDHPEWFTTAFGVWYRLLIPILARRAKCIIAPSYTVKEKLRSRFGLAEEHLVVVPGGVDTEEFHPGAAIPDGLPDSYFLFVGSLQPRKNLFRLLKAWQSIQYSFPNTWLLVAGTGNRVFRTPILPACKRVVFLGYISDALLPGLYARALFFILPSLDEGLGLPILEAMACGTPVIAANTGALPEVIGDAGLLFDPLDITAIAGALRCGLRDSTLRDSFRAKGLARVRQFSWMESAQKTWRIFEKWR